MNDQNQADLVEASLAGEKLPSCPFCEKSVVRQDDPDHDVFVHRPLYGVPVVYVSRCNLVRVTRIHA